MVNKSLFVSDLIVPKEVVLPDGTTETLYFKKLPALEFRKFYLAEQSTDENVKAEAPASLIAASFVDEKGKRILSKDDVSKLSLEGMALLSSLVMEVNALGDNEKKD
jgi:hypothetical protein